MRHCGFAGFWNRITVVESTMKQVEIVRKTREFFEDTGVVPHPDWIDPPAKPGTWVVNLAGMLGRMPWKDLPERFQHSRGFFTSITGSRIRSWVSCFWNSLFWVGQDLFRRPPTSAEVDNLAERFNILTGMWLCLFHLIKSTTYGNGLWNQHLQEH